VPWAAVVADGEVEELELIRHCRRHLSSFKVPRRVVTVAELPKLSSSKVDRRKLSELIVRIGEGGES